MTNSLKGPTLPAQFQDFASNVYASVRQYNTGEEFGLEQQAFYDEHFAEAELSGGEWALLEWISGLLLELAVIAGGDLDFDFYSEFEGVEEIDLFYEMEGMLNALADSYATLLEVSSFNDVYQTEPYRKVLTFVCHALKTALRAEPEQYPALLREYSQQLVVPEEYTAQLITF